MKRPWIVAVLLCLTGLAHGQSTNGYVNAFWNFSAYPGLSSPVSRVEIQPIPPYTFINGQYLIPAPIIFTPGTTPQITNGVIQTNVATATPLKVTFSGPFGFRIVTNYFPAVLTNSAGPFNAQTYDVFALYQLNPYTVGIAFTGTNFLGAGLAPTNLTGLQGIIIGGVYPNYTVGAAAPIVTNNNAAAVTINNNLTASNVTANANLAVATNITASGGTFSTGLTNQSLTTGQLVGSTTGGQEVSVPYSAVTNGVSAALIALNASASNSLVLQIATVGLNNSNFTAAVSNSLVSQIGALGAASSNYVVAVSNSLVVQLAALGLNGSNFTLAWAGILATNSTNFTLTASNALAAQISSGGITTTNFVLAVSNSLVGQITAAGLATTNYVIAQRQAATNTINAATLTGTAPVAVLPVATSATLGVVRPDNSSVTISGGVLSATGGGGGGSVTSVTGDGVLIGGTITSSGTFSTVPTSPFYFLSGPISGGAAAPAYIPWSNMTNGVDAAFRAFTVAASNSLVAQIATVGLNNTNFTVAVSNSIVSQIATLGTAGSNYTLAVSNSVVAQIAALGLNDTNYAKTLVQAATNSIAVNSLSGTIATANLPTATSSTLGIVKPDNTTVSISGGILSAVAGGVAGILPQGGQGSNNIFVNATNTNSMVIGTLSVNGGANVSNNLTASNATFSANLTVTTNVTANGLTVAAATNSSLSANQLMGTGGASQQVSVTYGAVTNGLNAVVTSALSAMSNFFQSGSVTLSNIVGNWTVNGSGILTGASIAGSEVNSGTVPVAQLPVATTSTLGVVRPDNSSIVISGGVISSTGGGGGGGSGIPTLNGSGTNTALTNVAIISGTASSLAITNLAVSSNQFVGNGVFANSLLITNGATNLSISANSLAGIGASQNEQAVTIGSGLSLTTGPLTLSATVAAGPSFSSQFFSDGTHTNLTTNQTFSTVTTTAQGAGTGHIGNGNGLTNLNLSSAGTVLPAAVVTNNDANALALLGLTTLSNGANFYGVISNFGDLFSTNYVTGAGAHFGTNGHFRWQDEQGTQFYTSTQGVFGISQTNGTNIIFTNGNLAFAGGGTISGVSSVNATSSLQVQGSNVYSIVPGANITLTTNVNQLTVSASGGVGTVTSVAVAADSAGVLSWSGSPITTAGTITPTVSVATTSQPGVVTVDNSTIQAASGKLSTATNATFATVTVTTQGAGTGFIGNGGGLTNLISFAPSPSLTNAMLYGLTSGSNGTQGIIIYGNWYAANVWSNIMTSAQCTDGAGTQTGSAANWTNWAPDCRSNYVFNLTNNLCISNVQGLLPNVMNHLDILLYTTNLTGNAGQSSPAISFAGNPTPSGLFSGFTIPKISASGVESPVYRLHMDCFGTNYQTNTVLWTLTQPGNVSTYSSAADTLTIGATGPTNINGVNISPFTRSPYFQIQQNSSGWYIGSSASGSFGSQGKFPNNGMMFSDTGTGPGNAALYISGGGANSAEWDFGDYISSAGPIAFTNIIGAYNQTSINNAQGLPTALYPMQSAGTGAAGYTILGYGTTSGASGSTLNPNHPGLIVSPFGVIIGYGDGTAGMTNSLAVTNTITAGNGFASYATNQYSMAATGYTNINTTDIQIFGLSGASIYYTNSLTGLSNWWGTIVTANPAGAFLLKPKAAVVGTSMAATLMEAH